MYDDIQRHLDAHAKNLTGPWVGRRSGYEQEACSALGIECVQSRYADAKWGRYSIELKKGRSIWLDIVRYSEIIIAHSEYAEDTALTLFLVPDKEVGRVTEVVCVPTKNLIAHLNINIEAAHTVLWLRDRVPRQLNAQANLTILDVKKLMAFLSSCEHGL